jgi:hypothetical protein
VRIKIEQTRTYATRADGGALSRAHAEGDPSPPRSFAAAMPRTPPPAAPPAAVDDIGDRWLAATGVPDVFEHAKVDLVRAEGLEDLEFAFELARSTDALGQAWVAYTTSGFA